MKLFSRRARRVHKPPRRSIPNQVKVICIRINPQLSVAKKFNQGIV